MSHLSESVYSADKIMLKSLHYLSQKGPEMRNLFGRMWRAFNVWYESPKKDLQNVAGILDDLLTTSYILDDLTDNGVLRRGLPAAHLVFGLSLTIYDTLYTAIYIFKKFLCFDQHKEQLIDSYIELCLQAALNEIMVIYFRDNFICPTDEEYIRHYGFTCWIPFSIQTMQLVAKNKHLPNVNRELQEKVAMFTAVYNDYINLQSMKYSKLKGGCDDVTDGKFSYLVIHALRSHPEDDRILKILKDRPTDAETKGVFVNILKDFGMFELAKKTLKQLRDEIVHEGEKLYRKKNPRMEKYLDDVLDNLESDREIYFELCSEE